MEIDYYAVVGANVVEQKAIIVFVLSLVAFAVLLAIGITWLIKQIRIRLKPLAISDNAYCTYLPTEKELRVNFVVCDFSNSLLFDILCLAHFGMQTIDVRQTPSSPSNPITITSDPNVECMYGKRMVVERLGRNIELDTPQRCILEVKMKPHGSFWAWKKKSIAVETLVIRQSTIYAQLE